MPRILLWSESFKEEEQTVKKEGGCSLKIDFTEEPAHRIAPSSIPPRTILTIRTHSRLNAEIFDRVDCVITRSTGYDHLTSFPRRVPVGYLPDYATDAVADHNLAVTMSLLRKLPRAREAMKHFDRNGLMGEEIRRQRVGIVGVGRIGKATAERFRGLRIPVRGFDVDPDASWARQHGVSYCGLEDLLCWSTVLILCLPLTPSTRMMLTRDRLDLLPRESLLVNCGRGEVVSSKDLWEMLDEGALAGVGLDVYNREENVRVMLQNRGMDKTTEDAELEAVRKLIQDPRVIATPHNAFNSRTALERKVHQTLETVRHFLQHGDVLHPIPD